MNVKNITKSRTTLYAAFLTSLPISVLYILDIEANKVCNSSFQLNDAALSTRGYPLHALKLSWLILKLIINVILSNFIS